MDYQVISIMNREWHVQKNKINLYFLFSKDMHAPTARKWRTGFGGISVPLKCLSEDFIIIALYTDDRTHSLKMSGLPMLTGKRKKRWAKRTSIFKLKNMQPTASPYHVIISNPMVQSKGWGLPSG
jgi:hypothetical protein